MTTPDLSVVFPLFNEAESIPTLIAELHQALDRRPWRWEMIAVNDGSTDQSLEVLRAMRSEDPSLRIISLERNSGQTAALDAGWRAARGRYVVSIDADLQNDPADIPPMVDQLEGLGVDMVIGMRANRRDGRWKRMQSKIGNAVRNWITRDRVTDTGCSLKVVRREVIDRVRLFHGMHRFLPTLVRLEGFSVIEVPVNHRPRRYGASSYGAMNRATRGLIDCFVVRWMSRRALRYRTIEE
ncbi:MAG TPA: glycosyltransferase family 2 protein [Thermoanaerobaculia bacterium]|nr:glycosyltransferase family 2 protein [Thermoanaerobaculia bacterium]